METSCHHPAVAMTCVVNVIVLLYFLTSKQQYPQYFELITVDSIHLPYYFATLAVCQGMFLSFFDFFVQLCTDLYMYLLHLPKFVH